MESPNITDDPETFIPWLRQALAGTLPGRTAQMKMAPPLRQSQPLPSHTPRRSAVLALLHESQEGIALIFTLRPDSLRHHAGQISFPGGGVEPQDISLTATALRETEEELGIPAHVVDVLGSLTPLYIAPSQNYVRPFVGWVPTLPSLAPNPVEVSAVLDVPLHTLLDPATLGVHYWRRAGRQMAAPSYQIGEAHIWGATAMMLSELLELIRALKRG